MFILGTPSGVVGLSPLKDDGPVNLLPPPPTTPTMFVGGGTIKTKQERQDMQDAKIKLTNCRVIFYNPKDEGFGCSITIDCTPPEVEKQIVDWVKKNNIGKTNPGVANIKEYTNDAGETTRQFQFKLNDKTQYAGVNGLTKDDIGYGAVVDLIANSFCYENKFGKGVSQSVSAIVVRSGSNTGGAADLAELLGDVDQPAEDITVNDVPF